MNESIIFTYGIPMIPAIISMIIMLVWFLISRKYKKMEQFSFPIIFFIVFIQMIPTLMLRNFTLGEKAFHKTESVEQIVELGDIESLDIIGHNIYINEKKYQKGNIYFVYGSETNFVKTVIKSNQFGLQKNLMKFV